MPDTTTLGMTLSWMRKQTLDEIAVRLISREADWESACGEADKAEALLRDWLTWAEAHETGEKHKTRVMLEQETRELLGESE